MKKIIDVIRWIVSNFVGIKQVWDLLQQIIAIIKMIIDAIHDMLENLKEKKPVKPEINE